MTSPATLPMSALFSISFKNFYSAIKITTIKMTRLMREQGGKEDQTSAGVRKAFSPSSSSSFTFSSSPFSSSSPVFPTLGITNLISESSMPSAWKKEKENWLFLFLFLFLFRLCRGRKGGCSHLGHAPQKRIQGRPRSWWACWHSPHPKGAPQRSSCLQSRTRGRVLAPQPFPSSSPSLPAQPPRSPNCNGFERTPSTGHNPIHSKRKEEEKSKGEYEKVA